MSTVKGPFIRLPNIIPASISLSIVFSIDSPFLGEERPLNKANIDSNSYEL